MFGVKALLDRLVGVEAHRAAAAREKHREHGEEEDSSLGLVVTIAVDVLIDGLLIGVGFAAGEEIGLLLTIALTRELLFLGLSVPAALLYLVTEELLVEAHEREDTPWVTALFFVGFLALFVLH